MINEMLAKRKLPDVLKGVETPAQWEERREEIKEILQREEYGFLPQAPLRVEAQVIETTERFCAGNAPYQKLMLKAVFENGEFSFPIHSVIPKEGKPLKTFVCINFSPNVPDKYLPSEEICDNGFACFSFCYEDVTSDSGDFNNGLPGFLKTKRTDTSPGKIMMWAWAAMRVMDYIQTLDYIDKKNIAVLGHSRLGKTALVTGAFDERFAFAISNESGNSGDALSRGINAKRERIVDIYKKFPFWFCENYKNYAGNEDELPFDQHFLLALLAPRKVYSSSADADLWADPVSQFLCCAAASKVYEFLGEKGLVTPDKLPKTGDILHEGKIGYHMRKGVHFFSRYDWQRYMEFINLHKN